MLKFIYIDFGSSKTINCPNKEEKYIIMQEKWKEKVTWNGCNNINRSFAFLQDKGDCYPYCILDN